VNQKSTFFSKASREKSLGPEQKTKRVSNDCFGSFFDHLAEAFFVWIPELES